MAQTTPSSNIQLDILIHFSSLSFDVHAAYPPNTIILDMSSQRTSLAFEGAFRTEHLQFIHHLSYDPWCLNQIPQSQWRAINRAGERTFEGTGDTERAEDVFTGRRHCGVEERVPMQLQIPLDRDFLSDGRANSPADGTF